MVSHIGYCRPMGGKVEFDVARVVKLETKRGIKWQVKGQYEGYNISVFTSEEIAANLTSQLESEEPMVFNAEIAWSCEESMPYFGPIFQAEEVAEEVEEVVEEAPLQEDTKEVTIHDDTEEGIETEGSPYNIPSEIPAQYLKKDGSPDMRYKICKAWVAKNGTKKLEAEPMIEQLQEAEETIELVAEELDLEAETYERVFKAEPNNICFTDHIPPETWNMMGSEAQGTYITTRDESLISCHRCGTSKADLRADTDANSECTNCVFEESFAPMHWANEPAPTGKQSFMAEPSINDVGQLMPDFSEITIPKTVYYEIVEMLPDTVTTNETIDGFSMTLTYLPQDAALMQGIAGMDTLKSPKQQPTIVLGAEEQESFMADTWRASANGEIISESNYFKNIFNIPENAEVTPLPTGELVLKESENYDAEPELTFDEWADQEDDSEDHEESTSFEEWVEEEISEHGDVKLSKFKEDELKEPEHPFYIPVEAKDAETENLIQDYVICVYPQNEEEQRKLISDIIAGNTNITVEHMKSVVNKTAPENIVWPEWSDEEEPDEIIYENIEWEAEEDNTTPKPTTIATLLAIGGLAAYLAPEQVRNFFKAFK